MADRDDGMRDEAEDGPHVAGQRVDGERQKEDRRRAGYPERRGQQIHRAAPITAWRRPV